MKPLQDYVCSFKFFRGLKKAAMFPMALPAFASGTLGRSMSP